MLTKEIIHKGFYKHEKFGIVPTGWNVVRLGDYFDFFPTASYSRSLLTETGECLYIHYGDLHTKFERFIDAVKDELPFIPKEMAKKYTPVAEGDLIISDASEDYEGVGKAVEVINVGEKTIISGLHTLHLRAKNNEFINGFKGYILNEARVRNGILRIATGIKVYSVSKTELRKIYLPKPPVEEQQAIATILSKVDEAIKTTENSIKAAEKLKRSLMQNLLTGKLKTDGTWRREDEFYKDEKFGNVPIGWQVKKVKEVSNCLDSKRKPIKAEDRKEIAGEYRYYGAAGIIDYVNDYIFDGRYILFGEDGENLISRKLPQAFIVEGKFWVNNHAHILESIENISDLDFLCYQLEFKNYENIVYGSAQPKINKSDLNKIRVLIPDDVNEQLAISKRISNMDLIIDKKIKKIKSLQRLKKSLMQNLLTGKLRVDINKIENILADATV